MTRIIAMTRVIFIRHLKKLSGGQIKVRDYFEHCLQHPALDPYVYFTPDSAPDVGGLWSDVPASRRIDALELRDGDLVFVAGRDWRWLPDTLPDDRVVNLVQHVKHGDGADPRFAYLSRPALRICVSGPVRDAIAAHAVGPLAVIPAAIPLDLFRSNDAARRSRSVLVLATKAPQTGDAIAAALGAAADVGVVREALPRDELARRMRACEVFVGLPNQREGFYLPALEAMAAGCTVVCADVGGNRGYCLDGRTALMPAHGDVTAHAAAVRRLLDDASLRSKLVAAGLAVAAEHDLPAERQRFYELLAEQMPDVVRAPAGVDGAER